MKRSISFVLCVIMLFSAILPVAHVFGRSEGVYVTAEGRDVEEIRINFDEKTVASAECFGFEAERYQWQILIDVESSLWVNIFDKTASECEISYALVKTVFDIYGEAFIRCKALYNGEWKESEAIKVSVSFEEKVKETVYEEPVLVTDMIIVESGEEIPEVIPETVIEGESILTKDPETEEIIEEEPVEEEIVEEEPVEEEIVEEEPVEEEIVEEETIEEEPVEEETTEEEPVEEEIIEEETIEEEPVEEETTEEEPVEEEIVEEEITEEEIIEGEIMLSEDYAEEEPQTFAFFSRSLNSVEGQALDGDGNEITEEFITITINYLDYSTKGTADEREIYSSYVASIQKGSHFAQKIISPTYTGFAPYYDPMGGDNITTSAAVMDLDLSGEETQNNIVYNVYYKAIEVPYGVRYFFQNINDDLYTERQEYYHVHQALTGTFIENKDFDECAEITKDTTGFELMYHIPDTVAADGSTVFELYYDRNYYLIQFNFDGGYGDDPIYARYGTPFVINRPIKTGYTFLGWDIDGDGSVDEVPTTIQNENQTYTAIWTPEGNTPYTVVYWRENANDNEYSYWGYQTYYAESGSFVNGIDNIPQVVHDGEKQYFTFNPVLSEKNVEIKGDGTTVVNVYYTRNYYSITFKAPGLCTVPERHTHTDACYDYICNAGNHVHDGCNLICTITPHVHDENCCGKEEHSHNENCYKNCKGHAHNLITCYTKQQVNLVNGTQQKMVENIYNPQEGYIYKYRESRNTYYNFFYLNGEWYFLGTGSQYSNINFNGTLNNPTSNKAYNSVRANTNTHTHSHTNDCLSCTLIEHTHGTDCNTVSCPNGGAEHTHGAECYDCKTESHIHTNACRRLICAITEGHTHNNTCRNSSGTNIVKIVTAKYQQSLDSGETDIWPLTDDNGKTYDSGDRWSPSESSLYNAVLVHISNMPGENFTLTLNTANYTLWTMHYYLEVLPGEEYQVTYEGHNYILDDTVTARYSYLTKEEDFFDKYGYVQYKSNPAFSGDQIKSAPNSTVSFYYNRMLCELEFINNGIPMDDKTVGGIMYGASIKDRYFEPEYPSNLEANAYEFAGWYTSPGCFDGTEVNWDTITMPVGNLLLYSKWIPKTHTVNFFESYEDMLKFENDPTSIIPYATKIVNHREVVGSVTSPEGEGESVFGGWFYIENGQKKAYTPTDFPIKRDMNIFADWGGGDTYAPFRISYFTIDENGVKHKVADDYTGFAKVGTTKTFNAKGGAPLNQLYPLYNNDAYFPVIASHSITIRYDEAKRPEDATKNVYEFEYVKAKIPISYKIMYYDSETNQPIIDPKTGTAVQTELKSTTNAVVTERFKTIEGYIPDAFYKRLVISVKKAGDTFIGNDEENVIIFYYSKNQESAYYAIHFMLEKLDSSGNHDYKIDGTGDYEENGTHIEGIGDIDSTIPINVSDFKFPGFDLVEDAAMLVVGGEQQAQKPTYRDEKYEITIKKNGTELYIFYDRNEYPYEVYYYLYNSTEGVPYNGGTYPHKTVTSEGNEDRIGVYGSTTVPEEAPKIPGYTCESQPVQSIIIREEEKENGNWVVTNNKIIFYYSLTQYTVEYIAVPENGGELSKTIEVITGNDDFVGSVPKAYSDYEFAGWFTDKECTVPVVVSGDERIADYNEETKGIKPIKGKMDDKNSNKFYAKFVPKTGKLTITRENACDDDQVYVYEVRNENGSFVMTVTVVGNASVTINNLPFGKYTVTQLNDWSWRNDDVSKTVNHESVEGSKVIFGGNEADQKWLNGNSALIPNIAQNIIEQEED